MIEAFEGSMVTPMAGGVDLAALARRAEARTGSAVVDLQPLPGGLSSITIAARLRSSDGRRVVLKVSPPGLRPVRNRDVLRQARVLDALSPVDGVTVPSVLFVDPGDPPMFAMTYVEGGSFEPVSSDVPLPPPAELAGRGLAASTMLAALHSVDPVRIGLGDEPVVALGSEVDRWEQALATVDEDLRGNYAECAAALAASLPSPARPAILHGDWRLGNMLCRGDRVEAVIDWEIWSVGDPRLDLAWFLANTAYEGNPFATREAPGLPDRSALLDAYVAARGSDVQDLWWFEALVKFKSAATMGLILKRNRRASGPDPAIEAHAAQLPVLVDEALRSL